LIVNNKERNTKTRSNVNHIITLSKTRASKQEQQLLKTAAGTHFYKKQLGLSA